MDNSILSSTDLILPSTMQSHSQVVCTQRNKENIKKELERNTRRKTIDKITRELAPACRGRNTFMVLNFRKFRVENPLYDMVKGMKPWLAFFTIWSNFLKKNGWKYSVDLEASPLPKH